MGQAQNTPDREKKLAQKACVAKSVVFSRQFREFGLFLEPSYDVCFNVFLKFGGVVCPEEKFNFLHFVLQVLSLAKGGQRASSHEPEHSHQPRYVSPPPPQKPTEGPASSCQQNENSSFVLFLEKDRSRFLGCARLQARAAYTTRVSAVVVIVVAGDSTPPLKRKLYVCQCTNFVG